MLDVKTGEVLALVSIPTYDLNIYNEGLTTEEWTALIEDPGQPLRNHAISDQLPPGSTFKVVTGTAALAEGVVTPDTQIYSPGQLVVHNQDNPGIVYTFGDTVRGVYDFRRGLSESSNVYFFYLAGGSPYRHPRRGTAHTVGAGPDRCRAGRRRDRRRYRVRGNGPARLGRLGAEFRLRQSHQASTSRAK